MQHLITISLAGIAAANNLKAIQASLDSAMQLSQTYGDGLDLSAMGVDCMHSKDEAYVNQWGETEISIGWICS